MSEILKIEDFLFKLYYTPSSPAAYSSCDRLYTYIKQNTSYRVKKKFIKEWLSKQQTYTMHKNRRIRFKRCHYNVSNIDDLWEMDLIDIQQISRKNKGCRYILAVIDCFSRYGWCIPIKRKTPEEVATAFETIFSSTQRRPITIQSDKGKEFDNKLVKRFFKQLNIVFRTTRDPVTKAAICERFIRTIKSIIYKYFTYSKDTRYIDVLNGLVAVYNNRKHSSIGIAPADVNDENVLTVWEYMENRKQKSNIRFKYNVGDTVRVSNPKTVFDKGYKVKWSDETFKIDKRISKAPPVYRLIDSHGIVIKGNFYECEIQKIETG